MYIDKTIKVAKETDEVMDLVVEVVKAVRGKQEYTAVVDELLKAIEGAPEVGKEAEDKQIFINTIGARSGDLYDAFQKVEEVEA